MNGSAGDAETLEATVAELMRASGLLVRRVRAENPHELSLSQASAMSRLAQLGPMTTADLARAESVKPQSMGSTLAFLEQEGLVERQPHPSDGRQVLFKLTPKGAEARRLNKLAKKEWLLAAVARLEPEEQQTLAAAARLILRVANS
jgi:DNA-binding MarR family transcriptional regulator